MSYNPLKNKTYNKIICAIVYLVGAFCTVIPVIVAAFTNNLWTAGILLIPCVAQMFYVTVPVSATLQEYQIANRKRGLIHEKDIYALFEENGTAKLHVSDIDTLPRYNVEIPETKLKLVPVKAFWIGDEKEWMETGEMTTKLLPECTNCGMQFGRNILENKNWKHCPCCGSRITGVLVPKENTDANNS